VGVKRAKTKKRSYTAKRPKPASKAEPTVGWYVDQHIRLRAKRQEIQTKLSEVKAEMTALGEEALKLFKKEELEGAKGKLGFGYIGESDHYNITDRRKFDAYVKKTGRLELFQGRVSSEPVEEIVEQTKKLPPGVGVFHKVEFKTTKRGGADVED
jgi:hypothetical protein